MFTNVSILGMSCVVSLDSIFVRIHHKIVVCPLECSPEVKRAGGASRFGRLLFRDTLRSELVFPQDFGLFILPRSMQATPLRAAE